MSIHSYIRPPHYLPQNLPLSFRYFMIDTDGKEQIRISGPLQAITSILPRGDPNNNYMLTVGVYVSDVFGASTRTTMSVEVRPPPGGELIELAALRNVLGNKVDPFLLSGDMQTAQAIVGSASVAMNLGPQVYLCV
jgi:hypothetical protein